MVALSLFAGSYIDSVRAAIGQCGAQPFAEAEASVGQRDADDSSIIVLRLHAGHVADAGKLQHERGHRGQREDIPELLSCVHDQFSLQ